MLCAAVLAVVAAGTVLGGASATGGVLFVSPAGSDAGDCTAVAPCKTIGHAVAVGGAGAVINVAAGTYAESVTIANRVLLLGSGAVIDATGHDNGILISGAGASGTSVEGFTVENATTEGILATATSHLYLEGNTVMNNDKGSGVIGAPSRCLMAGNEPNDCGEGLHLNGVTDSTVTGNEVTHNVGGILLSDEMGPTARNTITSNYSHDNQDDCGITLASHNGAAVANPAAAGVYDNSIIGNRSQNNGAGGGGAGVGMFAPFPGTASYDNSVIGNVLTGNSEAGAAIHAHAPGQNVSGNQIIGNTISGNGSDPDAGANQPTGISLWSAVVPTTVTVIGNSISNEYYGIFVGAKITVNGLITNSATNVTKAVGP